MQFRYVSVNRDEFNNCIDYTPKDDWSCYLMAPFRKEISKVDMDGPTPRCREVFSGEIEQCLYCHEIVEWIDESGVYGEENRVFFLSMCTAPLSQK